MKVKELIDYLKDLDKNAEIVSIEIENWQDIVKDNAWRLETDYVLSSGTNAQILTLKSID